MRSLGATCSPTPSLHVFLDPFVHESRDLQIVLLDHHHMAVTTDTLVLEPHVLGLHACLVEVLRGAVVVSLVIRSFCGHDHYWDVLQVDELPRRRLRHPAD